MEDQKKFIYDYLYRTNLGVISTVTEGGLPEVAVMGFGVTENLEIIFGTSDLTRKYKNIQDNPNVAWAFGWTDASTIQYEGVAIELLDESEINEYKEVYYAKSPGARKFDCLENKYFKVIPKWIRFSDGSDEVNGTFVVVF